MSCPREQQVLSRSFQSPLSKDSCLEYYEQRYLFASGGDVILRYFLFLSFEQSFLTILLESGFFLRNQEEGGTCNFIREAIRMKV